MSDYDGAERYVREDTGNIVIRRLKNGWLVVPPDAVTIACRTPYEVMEQVAGFLGIDDIGEWTIVETPKFQCDLALAEIRNGHVLNFVTPQGQTQDVEFSASSVLARVGTYLGLRSGALTRPDYEDPDDGD